MAKRRPQQPRRLERQIRVRGVRNDPIDIRRLSRVIVAIALEQAQAEADARSSHQQPPAADTSSDAPEAPKEAA